MPIYLRALGREMMETIGTYVIMKFLGEDKSIWDIMTSGNFSLKITYLMLFARHQVPTPPLVRKCGTNNLFLK